MSITPRRLGAYRPIIEQAHTTPITCLAYSHRLSIVATAAPDGACHVWDFQVRRYQPLLTTVTRPPLHRPPRRRLPRLGLPGEPL